jgi:hypothetical protein
VKTPIAVSLWLLLVLVLFALAGVWLIVIAPPLTRTFYRRRERVIRQLDERLGFGLSNYVLARRSEWLDRLRSARCCIFASAIGSCVGRYVPCTGFVPSTTTVRPLAASAAIVAWCWCQIKLTL